jgi:hypothetical protein
MPDRVKMRGALGVVSNRLSEPACGILKWNLYVERKQTIKEETTDESKDRYHSNGVHH